MADQATTAAKILGVVRLDLGQPHGHEALHFVWVVDFPVFEESADGELAPVHHPFTAPVSVEEMRDNPATAISRSYDLVLNGSELGSGSVRIHDPDVQQAVFDVLGISKEDAASRFGWFVRALRYGTPPHAGFAIGVDRLFAILQEENSIRDVIPFPKTQTGGDPLTTAPTLVDASQLAELGIDLTAATKLQLAAQLSDEGGGGAERMSGPQPDLFAADRAERRHQAAPLAARMRPRDLSEVAGQQELLKDGAAFRTMVESGRPVSMILFGPPGTGKTTLARLVGVGDRRDVRATLCDDPRSEGRPRGSGESPPLPRIGVRAYGAVPRRDPPVQQSPAGRATPLRRGRNRDPGRSDDRESVL